MKYAYSVKGLDVDSHVYSVESGVVIVDEEVMSGRIIVRVSEIDLNKIRRFVGNGPTFKAPFEKQEDIKITGIKELFNLINKLVTNNDFCNYQFHKTFGSAHNKKLVLKDSSIIYDLFKSEGSKDLLERAKKVTLKLGRDFNGSV